MPEPLPSLKFGRFWWTPARVIDPSKAPARLGMSTGGNSRGFRRIPRTVPGRSLSCRVLGSATNQKTNALPGESTFGTKDRAVFHGAPWLVEPHYTQIDSD